MAKNDNSLKTCPSDWQCDRTFYNKKHIFGYLYIYLLVSFLFMSFACFSVVTCIFMLGKSPLFSMSYLFVLLHVTNIYNHFLGLLHYVCYFCPTEFKKWILSLLLNMKEVFPVLVADTFSHFFLVL